jgi:hypothetical protein
VLWPGPDCGTFGEVRFCRGLRLMPVVSQGPPPWEVRLARMGTTWCSQIRMSSGGGGIVGTARQHE